MEPSRALAAGFVAQLRYLRKQPIALYLEVPDMILECRDEQVDFRDAREGGGPERFGLRGSSPPMVAWYECPAGRFHAFSAVFRGSRAGVCEAERSTRGSGGASTRGASLSRASRRSSRFAWRAAITRSSVSRRPDS